MIYLVKGGMIMFLNIMNNEEKEKFLELVYKVANADGDYAEEEQEIVNSYKNELEIDTINDNSTIIELIEYFANKNEVIKKVVMFETVGIVNADAVVVKAEKEILKNMNAQFALGKETYKQINDVAEKLQKVYDEIYNILFD